MSDSRKYHPYPSQRGGEEKGGERRRGQERRGEGRGCKTLNFYKGI